MALSLFAAAGLALAGCVASPQARESLRERRCERVRAALARHPDSAKLQRYAAAYCLEGPGGQSQAGAQPSSARCRKIQAALERHPDNAKFQRLAARYCPQGADSAAPPVSPAPAQARQTPAAEPAAAPAESEKPRVLSPEESKLINEQLLP